MVGEDQQPIVSEDPTAFLPHCSESVPEQIGIMVLDFFVATSRFAGPNPILTKDMSLPNLEGRKNVGVGRREGRDEDGAEHRAESLRPPLVDVIDRAVDLLAPAFKLSDVAQVFERKGRLFNSRSRPTRTSLIRSVRHAADSLLMV